MENKIGEYCKHFRMSILNKTLYEVADGENIKTLSGFENGRSTNIKHLEKYLNSCETYEMKRKFILGLIEVIEKTREF